MHIAHWNVANVVHLSFTHKNIWIQRFSFTWPFRCDMANYGNNQNFWDGQNQNANQDFNFEMPDQFGQELWVISSIFRLFIWNVIWISEIFNRLKTLHLLNQHKLPTPMLNPHNLVVPFLTHLNPLRAVFMGKEQTLINKNPTQAMNLMMSLHCLRVN